MNKSESIAKISLALSKAQGELKNVITSAENPFFHSKYAPLSEIINLIKPILASNELSYIQSPIGSGDSIGIVTLLMHSSGEWIESDPVFFKLVKVDPQGAGSAITYLRRYSISAMLGIASDDDDDGNNASQPKPSVKDDIITESQQRRIFALAKGDKTLMGGICALHGYKNLDIMKKDYEEICKEIEEKVNAVPK